MAISDFFGAGIELLHYVVLNDNNYAIGNTASGPTAGAAAGQGMKRLRGAQTVPYSTVVPTKEYQQGDNEVIGSWTFPADSTPEFQITTGVEDPAFNALVNASQLFNVAGFSMAGVTPDTPSQPRIGFIVQRQAREREGNIVWIGRYILNCRVVALGEEEATSRQLDTYSYDVTTSFSNRLPTGASLNTTDHNRTRELSVTFQGNYPLYMHTFVLDGGTTAFTLPIAFIDDTAQVRQNGALLTGGGVDYTLSGTSITLPSGTSGDIVNVTGPVAFNDLENL